MELVPYEAQSDYLFAHGTREAPDYLTGRGLYFEVQWLL